MASSNKESTSITTDPNATLAPDSDVSLVQFKGRVFGDFKLVDEIARGGMGVVFKAQQLSLNRVVAVKMTLAGQFARPADVQRFRAEAEAAAALDHSNILPVYEVGAFQGQPFFAMKLVTGGSLATEFKKRYTGGEATSSETLQKKIAVLKSVFAADSIAPLVRLIVPVARAVHFAHQRGILHRDLKPGNILIDEDGTPYVTDFGLAKRVEGDASLTQTGAVVGTPSYMAPEQARAEKQLTTAVDVYSLGAILYEALTGRPPFRAATVMETIMQVLEREPDPPSKIAPGADKDLSVIAMKCLEKEPSRRYSSAAEFASELDRWLKGESIQARQVGNLRKTWRWAKRQPLIAALALASVVALVGGIFVATRLYLKADEDRQMAVDTQNRLTVERDNIKKLLARAEQRERRAIRMQYASDIALAASLINADAAQRALPILHQHRLEPGENDIREFEWHYLNRICMTPELQNVAPNKPKKFPLPRFPTTERAFGAIAFAADGRTLLAGRGTGTTLSLDSSTGMPKTDAKTLVDAELLAMSRTPERLALIRKAEKPGVWMVWNSSNGTLRETPSISNDIPFTAEAWTLCPKGKTIVGPISKSQSGAIVMYDLASKRETVLLSDRAMSQINLLAFSSDGEQLFCLDHAGMIHEWSVATGTEKPIRNIGIEPRGQASIDRENGQIYFAVNDGSVYRAEIATGQLHSVFSGRFSNPKALFLTPGNRRLFVWAELEGATDVISIWDMELQRELLRLPINGARVHAVDLSPDGAKLAAYLSDGVVIWDATPIPD